MVEGGNFIDERMFVFLVAPCTATVKGEMVETIIHYEEAPAEHHWCLVTYRNTSTFPVTRIDHFRSRAEAETYKAHVEPQTPLVSHSGKAIQPPISYEDWKRLKTRNGWTDFDFRVTYLPGGKNAKELVLSRRPGF